METNEILQKLLKALGENFNSTTVIRMTIGALNVPMQIPSISVPDGVAAVIKAWQGNTGIVWIGRSRPEAISMDTAWPLNANEAITYRIQNTDQLYVCAIGGAGGGVPGDAIFVTTEQRRP